MKTKDNLKSAIVVSCFSALLFVSCAADRVNNTVVVAPATAEPIAVAVETVAVVPPPDEKPKKKIRIALLLDTSNSMDGLIDQARAQLWKLVNELSLARYENEKPELEIALYEYGNARLRQNEGFVRQVLAFTGDLDLVSEKLFSLNTDGGEEYCGHVIALASQQLEWKKESGDLQLIFIAGNESFYQGSVDSKLSCATAKEKDIVINTIFCGDFFEGTSLGWGKGALLAGGNYMNIDQDKKTIHIDTPYDDEIAQLNDRLNDTYVSYGVKGYEKKLNQVQQDKNAGTYGKGSKATRVVSKSGKFYSNSGWDLVDASKTKQFDISKVKEDELPVELKNKTLSQKKEYISQKTNERSEIIKQIEVLAEKRKVFVAEKMKAAGNELSLDAAMIKAIREQAAKKNFVFDI